MARAPAADSREALLDAAERVFGDLGYDKASIRSISARARVSSALIQYHFGGKKGLYEHVIERRLSAARHLFEGLPALVEATSGMRLTRETLVAGIRTVMRGAVRMAESAPSFDRIMRREESLGFPVAGKVLARVTPLAPLIELIGRAQEEGIVRRDLPPWLIASTVFGLHRQCRTHVRVLELFGIEAPPLESLLESSLSLVLDGAWTEKRKR